MFGQKVNNFFTGENKDINMQRLAGIGAVLQGQNASPYLGNINAMQEQNKQEAADEERKAKIMEAMQGLGIGGPKAAILGTMSASDQSRYLLGEMQRREAAGRASAAAAAKKAEEQEALKKMAGLFSPIQTQQAVTQMGGNPADMAQGVNTAQQGVVTANRIARPSDIMERVIAGGPEFFMNKSIMDAVGTYGKAFDVMNPQPKPTDDIREYEYAQRQGYTGSFQDFLLEGNSASAIGNHQFGYGSQFGLKPGERLNFKTGTVEMIPGSQLALEAEQTALQGDYAAALSEVKNSNLLEALNLNIKEVQNGGLPVAGAGGDFRRTGIGRAITGGSAVDFENRNAQILDSAALEEIQNMKKAGQGVGQLTEGERVAIGNAVTGLNTSTSADEYERAAKIYRETILNTVFGFGNWKLNEKGEVEPLDGGLSDEDLLKQLGFE